MISTGFDARVKIQQVIENQLPEFIISESPKASEFLKQYYVSQEFQGGPVDIAENLDQYIKLNNLTPDTLAGVSTLTGTVGLTDSTISVSNTKGFPSQYGLLKIDNEIITYTGITTNSFTGCIRGFSGIVSYQDNLNSEELQFSTSKSAEHKKGSNVENLSSLFLKEFFKKIKYLLAPGFEGVEFVSELNVNNFIKNIKSFYQAKGTEESFKILYKILYGIDPKILNLEEFLIKPSSAEFIRREVIIAELISGTNPNNLVGQVIKSSNDKASAPVSEVEIVRRGNKSLYKIQLFAGYNDRSLIEGFFEITPKTKVIEKVNSNDTVISVDSTIGFSNSGSLICGSNTITYTDKSINQFFGCSNIKQQINSGSDIISDKIIYGYENGDLNKKVELRITGVISDLKNENDIYFRSPNENISVKHIGDKIENPPNKTYKEFFFNSWVYNTNSRYEIESFSGNQVILYEIPDKSSLRVGDNVNILDSNSENIILENIIVNSIVDRVVSLNKNLPSIFSRRKISIRRNIRYASSTTLPLKYPKIIADIQNTYNDNDEYGYIASNSLPSFNISKNIISKSLTINASSNLNDIFLGSSTTAEGYQEYSIISFDGEVPFITGDAVVYTSTGSLIKGLNENQTYYVEVLQPSSNDIKNKIRLYNSLSFIINQKYLKFGVTSNPAVHTFTLKSQQGNKKISPKKILRKLPLNQNIQSSIPSDTLPGPTGMLINGVEIINYKSNDKIYYGPIKEIRIINNGIDYDVINPPKISISKPNKDTGINALVDLVVRGNLKEVIVDPNEVAIEKVLSLTLTGGNGSGAVLEPLVQNKFKDLEFNAVNANFGGGLDVSNETITFLNFHQLKNGTPLVYNQNGNKPIGIGSYGGSNSDQDKYLMNGSIYFPEVINSSSIKLYNNLSDLNSGINTIGFTTTNNGGIHKFRLLQENKVLTDIKIINPGFGYENRSLKVSPSGISTVFSTINFKNHNFNDGDLINYRTAVGFGYTNNDTISGLSTTKQYYVSKIDDSSFKLSEAGNINDSPSKINFDRGKYVKFESIGSGQQIFEYPPIKLNVELEYAGTIGTITATPILRGEIVDSYLYESGSDYGSDILNFHKRPLIDIINGSFAQLKPIVIRGSISGVEIQNTGKNYNSPPELIVTGDGIGAKLRAVVRDGKIVNVIIISGGANYNENNTKIIVNPVGRNALLECDVRSLTVNNQKRFSEEIYVENLKNNEELFYGIVGYSTNREGLEFLDPNPNTQHSKVIGWAYDGNPIYGPYGYSNSKDDNSAITLLKSGYELNINNVDNRPNNFELGFFVEDYKYKNAGDLDIYNGRYTKTPEFPNGVYAYHVTISKDLTTNTLVPSFPYFIGNQFKSNVLVDLNQNQNFDFNNSNLVRNTFPHRVDQEYSSNDFIIEPYKSYKQTSLVESVSGGSVDSLNIVNPGNNYSVGDQIIFDNKETSGSGASAIVDSILGKEIVNIQTTSKIYENSPIVRKSSNQIEVFVNPYHSLNDGDVVEISGFSTSIGLNLSKNNKITVISEYSSLIYDVSPNNVVGFITDIYISPVPNNIGVGNTISIGTEVLSILNIFREKNILRVSRGIAGAAHTATSKVIFYPNKFTIDSSTNYFDSNQDDKVYFNPSKSVGIGTISGEFVSIDYNLGTELKNVSVETQSIYLPNHPFKNNQKVLLVKPNGSSNLIVRDNPNSSNFSLPNSGTNQYVYIISKSKDFIGIVTQVGLTTTTKGLYFINNGDNNDLYYLKSSFEQVTANVKRVTSKVLVSIPHEMENGDLITLNVKPNLSIGLKNSESIVVKFDNIYQKLLINPIGFSSSGISTISNRIYLPSHNLLTGQKVFYNSQDDVASGLTTGDYFVSRIDDNYIQLSETYNDLFLNPPKIVSIGSTGGSLQELSLINPQLKIVKNNNIVFDLSDSSLSGYNFKLFFDEFQNNECVSIGNSSKFLISQQGTIGVSTDAKLTVNFEENLPSSLYYNLEKSGNLLSIDKDQINSAKITFINSVYNGQYKISGVGSTFFNITLNDVPEKYSYNQSECHTLKYDTVSTSARGGIKSINLISGGFNYTKLPTVLGVSTLSLGSNAIIRPNSTNIGKIQRLRILNEGYEYSSDKTLKPKASIPRFIKISNSEKLSKINITFGGRNFLSEPNLILVNDSTRQKVDNGLLRANIKGSSVVDVNIIEEPRGLDSVSHTLFTEKNSNGVKVEEIESYEDGIVTCILATPTIDGFVSPPFKQGDYIYVEGLQKKSEVNLVGITTSRGTGFNSSDNGYRFFRVTEFINEVPAKLKYNIGEYTSDAGEPIRVQTSFNSIVNKKNYPLFDVIKSPSNFFNGEKLLVNGIDTDLIVDISDKTYITLNGKYKLSHNDLIYGSKSSSLAKVTEEILFSNEFNVDYSNKKNYGWKNQIGQLNNSYQVLPDNDYFQNLSYSIKTTGEGYKNNKVIGFNDVKDFVNRLAHPSGFKNFSDVGITSSATIGIGSDQTLNQILDFITEKRVDTINNFDLGFDYDPTENSSNAIILKTKKLSDYIECLSNRVLQIDNISGKFSSQDFNRENFVEAYEYSITDYFSKFLVQVSDENRNTVQTSELVILNNFENTYTLNKADLYTGDKIIGNFSGSFADNGNPVLKFSPLNPFDFNYNIKIYRDYFSPSFNNIGVGYVDIGFTRLVGKIEKCAPNNGSSTVGITTDIFISQASSINSIYSNVFVLNEATMDMNYFEVVAHYDGEKSYISEYYFNADNNISGSSFGFIGTFGVTVSNGIFKLHFTNKTNNPLTIKAKTVGIATIGSGIGTYRFLVDDQNPGTERSARLESLYQVSVGSTTIAKYPLSSDSTLKSLVRVGVGSTVALHQILVVSDQRTATMQSYPFLSSEMRSKVGIGTFGVSVEENNVVVRFYPDSLYNSSSITIQKFNQIIYLDIDEFNVPNPLNYGIGIESLETSFYGSLNKFGKDRLEFDLNYERTPIFEKTFNPKNENILNPSTGIFSIKNHFFQTGEELIYTPDTTLVELLPSPIGIGSTLVGGKTFNGEFIIGLSTITGVGSSSGISVGDVIYGNSIEPNTTIVSIGSTYTYFKGDVVSAGSTVITGVGNTAALVIGSGIYSGNNTSLGTIVSIGINSITSSSIIPVGSNILYYSSNLNTSLTLSNPSTQTSIRGTYTSGIVTNICPSTVYVIKIDSNNFKITGTKGQIGVGFTFTSLGSGNYHRFEMKKKNEKSLISVNGVNQYPLIWTPVNHTLNYNGGSIGVGITFISLSGISSITPRDLIKIDNEFIRVVNVGFGTTNTGPVTGIGTIPLIEVNRGYVGTSATSHFDGAEARVYKGSYNIVRSKIYFTEAPDGKGNNDRLDSSGLPLPKSTFNGRVFLRQNYNLNKIYDDVSQQFSGISRSFTLTQEGQNTFGIEPGSGLVFINDVFQTPDTANNAGNNYNLSSSSGITTITFTSVTRPNTNDVIVVSSDINQNQVPRGGVIVSLGSTGGLGYAPLVGASVTAIVGAGGSIVAVGIGSTDILGSGYNGNISIGITDPTGNGASIQTIVGAGGSLSFKVIDGGSNYTSPIIKIDSPSYQNLSIVGISRLSTGISTLTGIGLSISVNIQPKSFKIPGKNADAARLIDLNKQLIADVAVGRMLNNYPGFSVPGGNKNCTDDIVSVLSSITTNLRYGGNDKVYEAAKIYIDNSYLSGEEIQAIYAFDQAKELAIQVMRNQPITVGGYSSLTQYFDTLIEGDISGTPGSYNYSLDCADVASAITQFVGIVTTAIGTSNISASKTYGEGSLFEVSSFEITKPGYAFQRGDKFKLVGLVTDAKLSSPVQELVFTVEETFTDSFACWQLGELDYIDSIKSRQNGVRKRFPLFRNNELLSFQKNKSNPESDLIDFDTVLLIFINGVMQEPKVSYQFNGGTTFTFTEAPRPEDNVSIFFYRGTRDVDSYTVNVNETVKVGDTLQLGRNENIISTVSQTDRIVSLIASADIVETGIYLGDGIDSVNEKPINWSKQKRDLIINESFEPKSRDSLESLVVPSAKVIKNISSSDTEIFLDSADLFTYEENESSIDIKQFSALLIQSENPTIPSFQPIVSSASTISSITILDGGSGYTPGQILPLKISDPIGVGITATANVIVSSAGTISSINITNPGFGYTSSKLPFTICPAPNILKENIPQIQFAEGFSGIITGITTTTGTNSNPLAIKFYLSFDPESNIDTLIQGYPITINDTNVGGGVTSINLSDSELVGIGTLFLDNIYYVHQISRDNLVGEITCNILSTSNVNGISTSGSFCGRFSWGRLYGITRSNLPVSVNISGYTVNSGLSSFPQILRRGYGLRDTGALSKQLPPS